MKENNLTIKRLNDLSNQATQRDIVTYSNFLNLNELNIFHTMRNTLYNKTECFGGYDMAERQMVAFLPDALCYDWNFPISCIKLTPKYPKYAENLSHRDILGAILNLGIDRNKIGDILMKENHYFVFCVSSISSYIMEELKKIKHTLICVELFDNPQSISNSIEFVTKEETIASNRIDCIIAKAYHLSRSEAAELLLKDRVFVNGKMISNGNHPCETESIISVRQFGRFIFKTNNVLNKKGKLRVVFCFYK